MVGLGDLDGGAMNSSAFGVSSDGSIVVGVLGEPPPAAVWHLHRRLAQNQALFRVRLVDARNLGAAGFGR